MMSETARVRACAARYGEDEPAPRSAFYAGWDANEQRYAPVVSVLRGLLAVYGVGPCRLRNGYCQEHYGRPCHIADARDVLVAMDQ